jgi:hypothetical protein
MKYVFSWKKNGISDFITECGPETQGLKLEPEAAFSILVSTRGLKKKDEVRHF